MGPRRRTCKSPAAGAVRQSGYDSGSGRNCLRRLLAVPEWQGQGARDSVQGPDRETLKENQGMADDRYKIQDEATLEHLVGKPFDFLIEKLKLK